MKHPFDVSRRSLFMAAAGALVLSARRALGEDHDDDPPVSTQAVGEEGGRRPPGEMTTQAVGEEGGRRPPLEATTLAVGEEGGGGDEGTKRFDTACMKDSSEMIEALILNPKTARRLIRDNAHIVSASKEYKGKGESVFKIEVKTEAGKTRILTMTKTVKGESVSFTDAKIVE